MLIGRIIRLIIFRIIKAIKKRQKKNELFRLLFWWFTELDKDNLGKILLVNNKSKQILEIDENIGIIPEINLGFRKWLEANRMKNKEEIDKIRETIRIIEKNKANKRKR